MQCSVVLLIIQIAPLVDNALAQSIERGQTGTPSYYRLAPGLDDMLTIDVNVWGEVSRPGRYTVPDYTDLLSLLSFAGEPTDDAKLDKIKIIRTLDGREEVIHIDLKRFLATADANLIPPLLPEDTIILPYSSSKGWRRVVTIISSVSSVISLAVLIVSVSTR